VRTPVLNQRPGRSAACRSIRMEICAFLLPLAYTRLEVNACNHREAAIEQKVDFILAKLRGTKRLDLFQPARIIHGVSLEQSTRIMAKFVARGKFDHIGLSEVRAEHIREAHEVSAQFPCPLNQPRHPSLSCVLGPSHRRRGN
jgi:aryl-alcohol dehydrogenase-like predicted oxidoreductase